MNAIFQGHGLKSATGKWTPIIKAAGIKAE